MAYRVPTNAPSLAGSSTNQLARPWRGSLVYPGRTNAPHETFVTAAETEGDNRVDLWNTRLFLQFSRAFMQFRDLSQWLSQSGVSLSAFMPDRLSDSNAHTANHRHFTALSQMLTQNQMVAFAPFNPSRPRSPGILIFPTSSSTDALLVGAVILNPELLDAISGGGHQFSGQSVGPQGYQQSQQINPHDPAYSYSQQPYMYSGGH